ncbi:MAG: hypothetical protein ACXQTS_07825 [Candidatus Methanospirareceae archaeon]
MEKGRKVMIGLAMAAIVAVAMMAVAPTASARISPTLIQSGDTAFIGEQGVTFDLNNNGVADAGDTGTLECFPDTPTEGVPPISVFSGMTIPEVIEGKYYFDANGNGVYDAGEFYVFITHASISGDIILNTAEQDSIVGKNVPTSAEIVFKIETNIGNKIPNARVDIKVYDPDGVELATIDGQTLDNFQIVGTTMFVMGLVGDPDATPDGVSTTAPPYTDALDLTNLGTYKVKFVLDKTSCNMLDVSSPEYTFTVCGEGLKIEAVEEVVSRGEDMSVIIKGIPKTYYYITITGVDVSEPPAIKMAGDVKARDEDPRGPDGILGTLDDIADGAAYPGADSTPNTADDIPYLAAWVQTGSDGIAEVKIDTTAADARTYTIHVYEVPVHNAAGLTPPPAATFLPDKAAGANNDVNDVATDDDDVDIKVEEAEVTFDMPKSVAIGSEVTIKGEVSAGKYVDIVIEDVGIVFDDVAVDENNEFEVDWDTSGLMPGFYVIDVYIDRADALGTEVPLGPNGVLDPSDYAAIEEDGKTIIRLTEPTLTAKLLRNVVAEGDTLIIEGTATGTDYVDIVLIGPKGYPATNPGLGILSGLEVISTSVTDEKFSEEIEMTGGLDTGTWIVIVASAGRDGTYGDLGVGSGQLRNFINTIVFAGKTQEQIKAILLDHTVNVAGSDDLLVTLTCKVVSPYVRLNPIKNVTVGEPLIVTGVSTLEEGHPIAITVKGPVELPSVIVPVRNGVFSATFDTSNAVPGIYTVKADDGEGHTDTTTVEILAPVLTVSVKTDKTIYKKGDTILLSTRFFTGDESLIFRLWVTVPRYGFSVKLLDVKLPPHFNREFTSPIPVKNWGNEPFSLVFVGGLFNITNDEVKAWDAAWCRYQPIGKERKEAPKNIKPRKTYNGY